MIIALSVGAVVVLIGAFLLFDHRRRTTVRTLLLRVTTDTPPTLSVEGSRLHPGDVFTLRTSDPASLVLMLELPNQPASTFIFVRHPSVLRRDDGSFFDAFVLLNGRVGHILYARSTGAPLLHVTTRGDNKSTVYLNGTICVMGVTYDAREMETPLIVHMIARKSGRTFKVALPLPHRLDTVEPQLRS